MSTTTTTETVEVTYFGRTYQATVVRSTASRHLVEFTTKGGRTVQVWKRKESTWAQHA